MWFSSSFFISSGSGPIEMGEETKVRKFRGEGEACTRQGYETILLTPKWPQLRILLLSQGNHKMGTWELCPFCPHVPRLEGPVEWGGEEPRVWTQAVLGLSTALIRDPRCELSQF